MVSTRSWRSSREEHHEQPKPRDPVNTRRNRRRVLWMFMAMVVLALMIFGSAASTGSRTNAERIDEIAKEIRCKACPGESVYESRVPFAENIKNEIARGIGAGLSDAAIKAKLLAEQGEEILQLPQAKGANSLLWVLPVLVVMCGGAGLGLTFRRWRSEASMVPSDQDRALVAAAAANTEDDA